MSFETKNNNEVPKQGLGDELNAEIAQSLTSGNYNRILEIIANSPDTHLASEVVVNSMFDFNTGSRAESVNHLVDTALNNAEENKDALLALIRYAYKENSTTERYWQNPRTSETLFINDEGEIISFKGEVDSLSDGTRYVKYLTEYTVLTGPEAGGVFQGSDKNSPSYRPIRGSKME